MSLREWLSSVQQEARLPEIIAERCVHTRSEIASCHACADACHANAWVIDDQQLGIDTTRCDGCGLCVAACPEAALINDDQPAVISYDGVQSAVFFCDKAGQEKGVFGATSPLACIHAITDRNIARLISFGVSTFYCHSGDCSQCSRYSKVDSALNLYERLERLSQQLDSDGYQALNTMTISAEQFHEMECSVSPKNHGVKISRRAFLGRSAKKTTGYLLPEVKLIDKADDEIKSPVKMLAEAGLHLSRTLHPELDIEKCQGCNACVKLCSHGALAIDRDGVMAYLVDKGRCTGCGLCLDVCEVQAIRLVFSEQKTHQKIQLHQAQCKVCGVNFHHPKIGGGDICPVCQRVNHRKNLYQVLP